MWEQEWPSLRVTVSGPLRTLPSILHLALYDLMIVSCHKLWPFPHPVYDACISKLVANNDLPSITFQCKLEIGYS